MDDYSSWSLTALLRSARATFGSAVRERLGAAGYDDVPPNGLFVLGAINQGPTPLSDIISALGVSKQTAGALVDSLVVRGYLDRQPDPVDRRRMVVRCSDRGAAAAELIRDTVGRLEAELEAAVGPAAVAHTKLTLGALTAMGRDDG